MGVWVWWNLNPDAPLIDPADRARITVLPLPTDIALRPGALSLDNGLTVEIVGHDEPRLHGAVERLRERLPEEARRPGGAATLTIDVGVAADESDPVWIDESYALDVSPEGARLRAATPLGALHGLQTFSQLVESDRDGVRVPAARVRDAPRFRWRGLMIDVCRHWIPKEVILRNLDAMEAAKLNVLHLHLTEDQAFRVESRSHPRLHEIGSGGDYFTQDDLREIVAYAHDRGIRVVPEFDLPGHSLSWLAAYPELGIDGGPWERATVYGIHPVALDPTRDEVYAFLDSFFAEMSEIFPDPYVHIGGDEAAPDRWNASPRVKAFQEEQGLADHRAVQAYFTERVHGLLAARGKRMMGWEEIRHGGISKDVLVQAWLMPGSLGESVTDGYETVLSQGYYLDHKLPAADHYAVDPEGVPEPIEIPTDGPWWSWAIDLDTPAGEMKGALVVWGEGGAQGGASSVAGRAMVLSDVSFDGEEVRARADTPVGQMELVARADGDILDGTFGSLVVDIPIAGHRVGGHDQAGTKPPELQRVSAIAPEDKYRIFGGEAAMWSELVTAETIDSRIWPRTAAIAERLWSPAASANDVEDMYRRLEVFSDRIAERGVTHQSYREPLLVDIAGGSVPPALRVLVDALEETKHYTRHRFTEKDGLTTETPLRTVADAAAPESQVARRFSADVDALLEGDESRRSAVVSVLTLWRDQHAALAPWFASSSRLAAVEPLSRTLAQSAEVALDVVASGPGGETGDAEVRARLVELLGAPAAGAEIAAAPALTRLLEARPID